MAIFNLTVQLGDDYGRNTHKHYELDVTDFATAVTECGLFLIDLAAITKLEVITYTIAQKTAYSDSVTAGANKDAGVTLSVRKTDGEKAIIKVPDLVAGLVLGDGTVDIAAATIIAFLDNWISDNFLVSDGEVVEALLSGKLDA